MCSSHNYTRWLPIRSAGQEKVTVGRYRKKGPKRAQKNKNKAKGYLVERPTRYTTTTTVERKICTSRPSEHPPVSRLDPIAYTNHRPCCVTFPLSLLCCALNLFSPAFVDDSPTPPPLPARADWTPSPSPRVSSPLLSSCRPTWPSSRLSCSTVRDEKCVVVHLHYLYYIHVGTPKP